MSEDQAARQDIRALRIGLLNLMPKKIQTETQFARLIGATPLQIELSLIKMTNHHTKNTTAEHMNSFYRSFAEVEATGEKFDGFIITGAPIEHLPFEEWIIGMNFSMFSNGVRATSIRLLVSAGVVWRCCITFTVFKSICWMPKRLGVFFDIKICFPPRTICVGFQMIVSFQ